MPSHPILPAGFNSDPIDGDEVDGAGTNWPVWPTLFDSYIGLVPLILTEDMLAAFDEIADICIAAVDNDITMSGESNQLELPADWPVFVPPTTSKTLNLPIESDTQKIGDTSANIGVPRQSSSTTLPRPARGQAIGRRR